MISRSFISWFCNSDFVVPELVSLFLRCHEAQWEVNRVRHSLHRFFDFNLAAAAHRTLHFLTIAFRCYCFPKGFGFAF